MTSGGRTRLILNLSELQTYTTKMDGNSLVVEVGQSSQTEYLARSASMTDAIKGSASEYDASIGAVDFRVVSMERARLLSA